MSAPPEWRRAVAGHLNYLKDLEILGVSKDPEWRRRNAQLTTDNEQLTTENEQLPTQNEERGTRNEETLATIREDLGPCVRCKLHGLGRKQIVFGVGNPNADLMFVGEAPGADEDVQGEPFVGRAGQLLTKIIEAIGLSRSDVYIANVLKCRPPSNRNPEPDEVDQCEPFLMRQIDSVKPKVIVALGTFAAHALLKTETPVSRLRGRVYEFRGGAKLIPTFHPAFLLRSPDRKRDVWEDMKIARALRPEESS